MKRGNIFRITHQGLLALTAILYASTTSLQLFNIWPSWQLLLFLGSGTLLAYQVAYWRPLISGSPFQIRFQTPHNRMVFATLLFLVLISLFQLPIIDIILAILMGVFSGLYFSQWMIKGKLQSGLRSVPLIKNILLASVWSATTVWFPAHQLGHIGGELYLFLSRFIYILALCFAVDLRDLKIDRIQQTRTLPVIYGYKKIKILCVILLLLFLTLTLIKSMFIEIPYRTQYHNYVLIASSIITIISLLSLNENDTYNKYTILMDGNMFFQSLFLVI